MSMLSNPGSIIVNCVGTVYFLEIIAEVAILTEILLKLILLIVMLFITLFS